MAASRTSLRFATRLQLSNASRPCVQQPSCSAGRTIVSAARSTRPTHLRTWILSCNCAKVAAVNGSGKTLADARWHSARSDSKSKVYDFDGVKQMIEDPSLERILIDVREPYEYEEGFIPTAINIPIKSHPDALFLDPSEFEDRFGFTKPPPNKEVVFYCKAGVRSSAAAAIAQQSGYENVGEYRGSWIDWEEHGGPNSKQTRGEKVEPMDARQGQTSTGNDHGL